MSISQKQAKTQAALDSAVAKSFMNDGAYESVVTGLGMASMDKDEHVRIKSGIGHINYDDLAAQYVRDGVVKRLCKMPPDKALKSPIVINGDEDDKAFKELTRLGFFNSVRKAGVYSRLFGGAIIVTLYDGDGDADLSKEPRRGAKVVGYRVFSPQKVMLTEDNLSKDKMSDNFGKIEIFPVMMRNGTVKNIHGSRCQVFKGVEIPDVMDGDIMSYVFGASEVSMANSGILKLPGAFGAISNMLQENGLSVFGLNGLSGMLSMKGGEAKVRQRMNIMKLGMSTMRAVVMDKEDTFDMKSHSMGDVPESVKMIMAYVSALTGFPVSILFGNMVSGLSSTNEGDIRQFDDLVEQWRMDCLYEPMCAMITDYMNRNAGKAGFHDFQFGTIDQPTASEKADQRDKNGNFCRSMFDMGAMTAKEVRENMLVNGGTDTISVKEDEAKPQT